MITKKYHNIDEYHEQFQEKVRERLDLFRLLIKEVIPMAREEISYNMPAFRIRGIVVYYSAFKNHISLFPAPTGKDWEKEFAQYKTSGKGTIQFPYDKPIPKSLIQKIVKHLAKQDAKLKK